LALANCDISEVVRNRRQIRHVLYEAGLLSVSACTAALNLTGANVDDLWGGQFNEHSLSCSQR